MLKDCFAKTCELSADLNIVTQTFVKCDYTHKLFNI